MLVTWLCVPQFISRNWMKKKRKKNAPTNEAIHLARRNREKCKINKFISWWNWKPKRMEMFVHWVCRDRLVGCMQRIALCTWFQLMVQDSCKNHEHWNWKCAKTQQKNRDEKKNNWKKKIPIIHNKQPINNNNCLALTMKLLIDNLFSSSCLLGRFVSIFRFQLTSLQSSSAKYSIFSATCGHRYWPTSSK